MLRRWPDDIGEALADIAFIEKMERGFSLIEQRAGRRILAGMKVKNWYKA